MAKRAHEEQREAARTAATAAMFADVSPASRRLRDGSGLEVNVKAMEVRYCCCIAVCGVCSLFCVVGVVGVVAAPPAVLLLSGLFVLLPLLLWLLLTVPLTVP